MLASQYGWTESYILNEVPYNRLIEYIRKIAKRNDKEMPRGGKLLDSELRMQELIVQYNRIRKEL